MFGEFIRLSTLRHNRYCSGTVSSDSPCASPILGGLGKTEPDRVRCGREGQFAQFLVHL